LAAPTAQGERIVTPLLLKYGRLFALSLTPSADLCRAGGDSWLYALDAQSGGALAKPALDINKDGKTDEKDKPQQPDKTVAGIQLRGLAKSLLPIQDSKQSLLQIGLSDGNILSLNSPAPPCSGSCKNGNTALNYWQQLQ
jgi:Tfp pilus tip-associated adhesin PilY1